MASRVVVETEETVDGFARVGAVRKFEGRFEAGCSCGWRSSGWVKKGEADQRLDNHMGEHRSGEPALELSDFRQSLGLEQPRDGTSLNKVNVFSEDELSSVEEDED